MTRLLYGPSMQSPNDRRTSRSDTARSRAATREFIPPLALLVLAQGSLIALDPKHTTTVWTIAWSLSPIIALVWMAVVELRALSRADEFQRAVQLESLAIGFGATILLAAAGGVLDAARIGSTRQSLQIVFIGGVIAWTLALAIKTTRTR